MNTISTYARQNYNANQACAIVSANPGQSYLRRWSPEPTPPIPGVSTGSDANNMQQVFGGAMDSYGLPTPATALAPNFQGFITGLQTPNVATYQVSYADAWIVVPAGVTTVSFGYRGFGNTAEGIYIGKAPRYAVRVMWNNVYIVPGGTVVELLGCDADACNWYRVADGWISASLVRVCLAVTN